MRISKYLLIAVLLGPACNNRHTMQQDTQVYAIRLKPGEDLQKGIQQLVAEKQIKAGWIAAAVGSLTQYSIRFANQPNASKSEGHFEIVSLSGTVSTNGSHLHIAVSDSTGATLGGHLMEGCRIYTTAELVIASSNQYEFTRVKDGTTPWEELRVEEAGGKR